MSLQNKTDGQILSELKDWVGKEREAVSHVLHYLREIEERKLYLQKAGTLKEFCMKVLKYSRHEAQARIDAMRLIKIVPEIDADLDGGRLSLTIAAQVMSCFRVEDQRREKAGEILLTEEEHKIVLADIMSSSSREADRKLAIHFPQQPQLEKAKPVSKSLTRIEFNADEAAMKKYERLQARYYHQTGGSWAKLFELLASHEIEKLDSPPRRAPGSMQTRTRYVRKHVDQEVWSNWELGCDHRFDNGERCGSKTGLQKDHIREFSAGGANDKSNLRLLCAGHNRFRSDRRLELRHQASAVIERTESECMNYLFSESIRTHGVVTTISFSQ